MTDLPPGVYEFSDEDADPTGNIILDVSGAPKTGKSHFAAHAKRPLYLLYSDPNTNLDAVLLKANADLEAQESGSSKPVFPQLVEPVEYANLTREAAGEIMSAAHGFGAWARDQGNGGTFVVDGALYLKGYFEKAVLGESATLGFRAEKGQRGPSPIEYSKSNTALKDFVTGFVGSDLDVILTWEGREIWQENWENGRKTREPTGKFKTSSPASLGFVTSAYIEMVMVLEPIKRIVDGIETDAGTKVAHRVRIGPNGYNPNLYDLMVPLRGPEELKSLLFAWKPGTSPAERAEAEAKLDTEPLPRVDPEMAAVGV